jgi:hypothetical protein
MKNIRRLPVVLALMCSSGLSYGQATLTNQVVLVNAAPRVPLPQSSGTHNSAETFTVTQAGSYTITVTDLGSPAALASLDVGLATSSSLVAQLGTPGTSASQTVTLAPATYSVQTLATAASGSLGGSFNVTVAPAAGGTALFQDQWVVSAASGTTTPGESVLSTSFSVSDPGTYQLSFTDQAFPVALQSFQIFVVFGSQLVAGPITSTTATLNLGSAGSYDLFVVAQAASPALAGLYSLQIVGGSSGTAVAYANSVPVGQLPAPIPVTITAASDTVSLALSDLSYPAALGAASAVVTEGSNLLADIAALGAGPQSLAAVAGTLQVFVLAQAGAGGAGSAAIYAYDASGTLVDVAQPVLATGSYGYGYGVSFSSAGSYSLGINDYQIPSAFKTLQAAVEQQGALVQNSNAAGSAATATFNTRAGAGTILVFPTLSGADGLFGVALSTSPAFTTTQGVGAAFSSQVVSISSTGNYVIEAADLAFPEALSTFAVILTSGQSVVNEIYGAGQLGFMVNAPGTYVINVLAEVGAGEKYGLYGVNMSAAAPPTVSLTATPTSVASGATTSLSWSSTGATSCTASGGWSGALAISGTQQSSALTAATTFSISCSGSGGASNASVNVTILPVVSKGGGGATDAVTLLALTFVVLLFLWRRSPRGIKRLATEQRL